MKFVHISEIENESLRKANIIILVLLMIVCFIPAVFVQFVIEFSKTVLDNGKSLVSETKRMWNYKSK